MLITEVVAITYAFYTQSSMCFKTLSSCNDNPENSKVYLDPVAKWVGTGTTGVHSQHVLVAR